MDFLSFPLDLKEADVEEGAPTVSEFTDALREIERLKGELAIFKSHKIQCGPQKVDAPCSKAVFDEVTELRAELAQAKQEGDDDLSLAVKQHAAAFDEQVNRAEAAEADRDRMREALEEIQQIAILSEMALGHLANPKVDAIFKIENLARAALKP
jgi:hypothetical protein